MKTIKTNKFNLNPELEVPFLRRDNREISFNLIPNADMDEEISEVTSYFNYSVLCDVVGDVSYENSEIV